MYFVINLMIMIIYVLGDDHDLKYLDGICCDENKKLKVFHSDPFDYQSIIDALRGCSGLFYTFEPPQDQPTYDVSKHIFLSSNYLTLFSS